MKTINIYKTLTSTFIMMFIMALTMNAQQSEVEYSSTASTPQVLLNETGKNNLTRLFMGNNETPNQFKVTSRFFESDLAVDKFSILHSEPGDNTTYFTIDAIEDEILLNGETKVSSSGDNNNPNLLIQEIDDNEFTRLHFRNAANATDKWSVATNSGTTAAQTFGVYRNSSVRFLYNEDISTFNIYGDLDVTTDAQIDGDLAVTGTSEFTSNAVFTDNARFDDFIRLTPLTAEPTCSAFTPGRVYYHGGAINKLRVCTGGAWVNLH